MTEKEIQAAVAEATSGVRVAPRVGTLAATDDATFDETQRAILGATFDATRATTELATRAVILDTLSALLGSP